MQPPVRSARTSSSRDIGIPGIKQLLNSQTRIWKRIVWFIVIAACVGAAVYQLTERISYYLSEPTSINVIIVEKSFITFPTVSICPSFITAAILIDIVGKRLANNGTNEMDQWCPKKFSFHIDGSKDFDYVDMNKFWQLISINKTGVSVYLEHPYFKEMVNTAIPLRISVTETALPWGKCLTVEPEDKIPIIGETTISFYIDMLEFIPIFNELSQCPAGWYEPHKLGFSFEINDIESPQYYGDGVYDLHHFSADQVTVFHLDSKQFFRKSTKTWPCASQWEPSHSAYETCMRNKLLSKNFACRTPIINSTEESNCRTPVTFLNASLATVVELVLNSSYYEDCSNHRAQLCQETKYTAVSYKSAINSTDSYTTELQLIIRDRFFEVINEEYLYDLSALVSDIGGSLGVFLGICVLTVAEIIDAVFSELALKFKYFRYKE